MRKIYRSLITRFITALLLIFSSYFSYGQLAVNYGTALATGLANAVDVVNAGDSRLFIAQQNGIVRIWSGTTTLTTFINLSGIGLFPNPLGSEQGLLSIAFHPQFATNRYFFIWYTASTGAVTLARYRANIDLATANPNTGVVLLSIPKPGNPYFTNHNGGKLNFGSDGMLYIGTGDGGDGGDPFGNAQNPQSYLGKMLRLNVNGFLSAAPWYEIPADNPFVSTTDGILDEIYALGLRNPWRWSFDRQDASMWIADVGQSAFEEVNYRTAATSAGLNYGWDCREGMHNYGVGCGAQVFTEPIFEYGRGSGQSITGGYVYRGPDPSNAPLLGRYICTDFLSGNLWIVQTNGTAILQTENTITNIAGFGEGTDGTLYAVRRNSVNGGLYKINLATITPVIISNFSGEHFTGYNLLKWSTSSEQNISRYEIEYSNNGLDFTKVGEVNATGSVNGNNYSFQHDTGLTTTAFYRIRIVGISGTSAYSYILRLPATNEGDIRITPTFITDRSVNISFRVPVTKMQLISTDGKIIFEKNLQNVSGSTIISLPGVPAGIYILQVTGAQHSKRERVFIR